MTLQVPDSVPASVNRYLLPRERQVISVRQHPAPLITPLAAAFGGLLAAIAATEIPGSGAPRLVAWLLLAFLVLRLLLLVSTWLVQYIVVTTERMLFVTGLINRKVESVPRADLVNLTLVRSSQGRRLGYGTFTIGYGAERVVIDLTRGDVIQRIMLPLAAVHITVVDADSNRVPGAALIAENTIATFDIYDGVTAAAVIRNQGGTSGASGVISYPSFVGAQAVGGYLTGAGGGPLTQVTIPAVRTDSNSVTVNLEA